MIFASCLCYSRRKTNRAAIIVDKISKDVFPIVESCLSDAEPRVRFGAVVAIGNMLNNRQSYAKAAIAKLKQIATNDPSHSVRVTAGQVLDIAALIFDVEEANRNHF